MRLIACLLVLVAALGASEERFVKRLDAATSELKRAQGKDKDIEAAVQAAADILVREGPLERQGASPVAATLRELIATNGPLVRWDRLGDREYGSHAQVFYVLLVFERGIAFGRVVAAKTKNDRTVLVAMTFSPDPAGILPQELMTPDGFGGSTTRR